MWYKFIDLFAWIWWFRQWFVNAWYECVFSSDINSHCQKTYEDNYWHQIHWDITLIDPKEIPDFDVLTWWFPCQPFSISWKKLWFEDTRWTLFFNICNIIIEKQPSVVVLENVKHIIHHDWWNTIKVIRETLKDLWYSVNIKVLNAKDFWVPQNRERVFIIWSKNWTFNFWLLNKSKPTILRDFLDKKWDFEFLDNNEYTLINEPKVQDSWLQFVWYRNKNWWKKWVRENTLHLSRVHRQPNRIYWIDWVHPTIPSQETTWRFFIHIPEKNQVRKLTITECYRIMWFPESFKIINNKSEAYRQIWNSVCIPVVEEVAKQIVLQDLLNTKNANEPSRKASRNLWEVVWRFRHQEHLLRA